MVRAAGTGFVPCQRLDLTTVGRCHHVPLGIQYGVITQMAGVGEEYGLSVFFRVGEPGVSLLRRPTRAIVTLVDARIPLDEMHNGWQRDFEEAPTGWPWRRTY